MHNIAAKVSDHSRPSRLLRLVLLIYRSLLHYAAQHFWPKPSSAVVPWRCSLHAHWALLQVRHGLNIEPSLVCVSSLDITHHLGNAVMSSVGLFPNGRRRYSSQQLIFNNLPIRSLGPDLAAPI